MKESNLKFVEIQKYGGCGYMEINATPDVVMRIVYDTSLWSKWFCPLPDSFVFTEGSMFTFPAMPKFFWQQRSRPGSNYCTDSQAKEIYNNEISANVKLVRNDLLRIYIIGFCTISIAAYDDNGRTRLYIAVEGDYNKQIVGLKHYLDSGGCQQNFAFELLHPLCKTIKKAISTVK